jgi:catechol 2,3-dioxygenase-like lactoylglutathione lyase family enzyme
MSYEIIGIDHVYFAVSDLGRSQEFYDPVMSVLGFHKNGFINDGDPHVQYYNRQFGLVLRPARHTQQGHDPFSPGLHHFCFRVDTAQIVDAIADEFRKREIRCSEPQLYPEYAPDYYAIFFSDPDGIQLEITNFRQERRKRHEEWPNA